MRVNYHRLFKYPVLFERWVRELKVKYGIEEQYKPLIPDKYATNVKNLMEKSLVRRINLDSQQEREYK